MTDDYIDYGQLIDEAMHYVVQRALKLVELEGLKNDHHFFITFNTRHPGVSISEELRKRYPNEMTIVLQHQFYDLEVDGRGFSVVLSFEGVKQSLAIPFDAMITFADPSVKFGLQFHSPSYEDEAELLLDTPPAKARKSSSAPRGRNSKQKAAGDGKSNVVALDAFRKKS